MKRGSKTNAAVICTRDLGSFQKKHQFPWNWLDLFKQVKLVIS
jgi:hypothetical protein